MLDEYALVPDIFDPVAYSNPAFIEMCLPHLKEPLLQEALVRDLCDGGWSQFCMDNAGTLHRLCKEILKKLAQNNRLRRVPRHGREGPTCAADWCNEGVVGASADPLTGVIAGHQTKEAFGGTAGVASIEKLPGTNWWQGRSPSTTVDRKTAEYLRVLRRVLAQANSLMFIDPNLDPSAINYREFHLLLGPVAQRGVKPRIEIHRSFCRGDGPGRTFPKEVEWRASFVQLHAALQNLNLAAEVFCWEDFHERYLIADVVGISVPAGFDVTAQPNNFSTWGRLGREDKDKIQRLFDPAARGAALKWRFSI
jgi:hypothetical protein